MDRPSLTYAVFLLGFVFGGLTIFVPVRDDRLLLRGQIHPVSGANPTYLVLPDRPGTPQGLADSADAKFELVETRELYGWPLVHQTLIGPASATVSVDSSAPGSQTEKAMCEAVLKWAAASQDSDIRSVAMRGSFVDPHPIRRRGPSLALFVDSLLGGLVLVSPVLLIRLLRRRLSSHSNVV